MVPDTVFNGAILEGLRALVRREGQAVLCPAGLDAHPVEFLEVYDDLFL